MNKMVLLLCSMMIAGVALADQTVRMSDGRVCTFRSGEFTGCTAGSSSSNRPPSVAETYLMQKVENRKLLSECLRKSDWPGTPSRSECERLYGQ